MSKISEVTRKDFRKCEKKFLKESSKDFIFKFIEILKIGMRREKQALIFYAFFDRFATVFWGVEVNKNAL